MRKSLAGFAAVGIVTAALLTAAPSASAAGCVTSGLWTGFLSPGQSAYKASSGCRDLNLTYSDDKSGAYGDAYAGYYRDAYGYWTIGSRGYVYADDGHHALNEIVLVSNLTSGREFSVASKWDGGDWVEITH
ncbi:hypothetical protein [Streptomyces sp. VRA16 Mangrove soil]|uniref:hypothetical protein n=1 Tax=Streptomyces sp. VRA16 Mangrove soil TaxID=2817434 RepID=UPI001A9EC33D|nr:hypothetical protein [Streptomyces sp. VRA16 Mangrove soil]MBO1331393.1 hypothetical protein [Streptomyces sp. VRA16 Mangrove soil]